MLHYVFAVSNVRNTPISETRPLNARSLALSALLGTHPPRLPARAFVALAGLFGIPSGTMRTALSRMVSNGEVVRADTHYQLSGPLLERQRAQDAGRSAPRAAWDGHWRTIITATDQRDIAERRHFRTLMANHRFGELRPDIWMRPANLDGPPADSDWICTSGPLDGIDAATLTERLWDLEAIAGEARTSLRRIDELSASTDWNDERSIPEVFTASATVLRFLRNEPLLPSPLTPDEWPVDGLRLRYEGFEKTHQALLRSFLRSA